MNPNDESLLQELGFLSETQGGYREKSWRVLSRNRRVLMLLEDQKSLGTTLGLYAPQRPLAQITVGLLKRFPFARRIMNRVVFSIEKGSPLDRIQQDMGGEFSGILLGNPQQKHRRALALIQGDPGSGLSVVKIGTTSSAFVKIGQEIEILKKLNERVPKATGIPSLIRSWREGRFRAFALPFLDSHSPNKEVDAAVTLLSSWLDPKREISIEESFDWPALGAGLSDFELDDCREFSLVESIRHGDFAPWNLASDKRHGLTAIDWESGLVSDIPGWDLIHFLWVSAELIERLPPGKILRKVFTCLGSNNSVRQYLDQCGWAGRERLLLKTYLLVSAGFRDGTGSLIQQLENLSSEGGMRL